MCRSLASYDGDSRLKLPRAEVYHGRGWETTETVFHVAFILIAQETRDSKDWRFFCKSMSVVQALLETARLQLHSVNNSS